MQELIDVAVSFDVGSRTGDPAMMWVRGLFDAEAIARSRNEIAQRYCSQLSRIVRLEMANGVKVVEAIVRMPRSWSQKAPLFRRIDLTMREREERG